MTTNLMAWNSTHTFAYSPGGQMFQTRLTGLKSRFFLEGAGEKAFPRRSQLLEATHAPWLTAMSLYPSSL